MDYKFLYNSSKFSWNFWESSSSNFKNNFSRIWQEGKVITSNLFLLAGEKLTNRYGENRLTQFVAAHWMQASDKKRASRWWAFNYAACFSFALIPSVALLPRVSSISNCRLASIWSRDLVVVLCLSSRQCFF
jgi:hypothetical protein